MKTLILSALFLVAGSHMNGQSAAHSPIGEYYLNEVRETASGFRLNPDSTFDFFFSQGALDRFGRGKWTIQNNKLLLNSLENPGRDFALVASKKQPGNNTTIQINDPNKVIQQFVYAIVKNGTQTLDAKADSEGRIFFDHKQTDSLSLVFEFCPEKTSLFTDLPKDHNYFEFRFEPWIMEYFFQNFALDITNDELSGRHPLLEGKSYHYRKAGR